MHFSVASAARAASRCKIHGYRCAMRLDSAGLKSPTSFQAANLSQNTTRAYSQEANPAKPKFRHPLITLEDHFVSNAMPLDPKRGTYTSTIQSQLVDLGSARFENMTAGQINLQVLSHVTGGEITPAQCRDANDELAAAVANPASQGRLAGFAALPMANPDEAAEELERCMWELGFVGALVDNHLADGRFYDGEEFAPVFEAAQRLGCALYLHPAFPAYGMQAHFEGNYERGAAQTLGAFGWGWHVETGFHVLRLFAAGVFDRFPRLKLVIGHMGEMLPFQLERIMVMAERGALGEHKRRLQEVWDENIWITTSGMFSLNPMACMLRNTRVERIMYSVDYPFASNTTGLEFMVELERSGLVTDEQLARIAYKNAEELLKVKV